MSSLQEIAQSLEKQREEQGEQAADIKRIRELQESQPSKLDLIELAREAKSSISSTSGAGGGPGSTQVEREGFLNLPGLSVLISPTGILATLAAVGAAAAGIRPRMLSNIRLLITPALRVFENIGDTIRTLATSGETFQDTISFVRNGFTRILTPFRWIMTAIRAVDTYIGGPGQAIARVLGGAMRGVGGAVAGGAGALGRMFSRVLWPVSILFSAVDAVRAFMESEGTLVERLGAGVGGFLGDFVGAPFDLIKNAAAWIIGRLFGVSQDGDGTYDESMITGRILNMVREFSFEELISNLVRAPFRWVQAGWDWIRDLFADPTGTLTELAAGLGNLASWIYDNAVAPVWNWLTGIFGDPTAALRDLWNGLMSGDAGSAAAGITDLIFMPINAGVNLVRNLFGWSDPEEGDFRLSTFVAEKVDQIVNYLGDMLDSVITWFRILPQRISLVAREKWANVREDLMVGFTRFGTFFASLPDRMLIGAVQFLQSILPNWALRALGADDILSGAQMRLADIESRGAALEAGFAGERTRALQQISAERAVLDRATTGIIDPDQMERLIGAIRESAGAGAGASSAPNFIPVPVPVDRRDSFAPF